jgi:putative transposase
MARPLRLEYPGALYHLTARGDRQEPVFKDDGDYLAFIDLLAKEVMQQGWVLYAFCLMGNHYHLLLETPEPNLVKGMRRLNGVYTQAFNRRHHRVGHVFQGRYKSILVDKESRLLELCRYVVLNPVRAGMVASVQNWRWSSYLPTCGKAGCPEWLAAERVLELFGSSGGTRARQVYTRFVAAGVKQPAPWTELKGQIFLGSDAFHDAMQARLRGEKPKGVSRRQLAPSRPHPQDVVHTVARAYGIKSSDVLDRRSGPAFQHAVYLLRRRANLSLQEVAQLAGVSIGRIAQIQSKIESGERDALLHQLVDEL